MSDTFGVGQAVGGAAQGAAAVFAAKEARAAIRDQITAQQNVPTHLYDPTNPMLRGLGQAQTGFLGSIYGGANPYEMTLPGSLQQNSLNALNRRVGAPGPENEINFHAQRALQGDLYNASPQDATRFSQNAPSFTPFQVSTPNFSPLNFSSLSPDANSAYRQGQALERFSVEQLPFNEIRNPYGDMGAINTALQSIQAYRPVWEQSLRAANTQLSNTAPNRFSSAFAQEGIDLNSRALADYNLFAGQALQQGQQLQAQQQAQALNFSLGARQAQQEAYGQNLNARLAGHELLQTGQLQARELAQGADLAQAQLGVQAGAQNSQNLLQSRALEQQLFTQLQQLGLDATQASNVLALQGWQSQAGQFNAEQEALLARQGQAQQGRFNSAQILGQLASTQGMNDFARLAQMAQLGMSEQQNRINPLLQMQLAGLQYGMPSDLNAIVGGRGIVGANYTPPAPPGGVGGVTPPGGNPSPTYGGDGPDGGHNGRPTNPPADPIAALLSGQPLQRETIFNYNNTPYALSGNQFQALPSWDMARQQFGGAQELGLSNEQYAALLSRFNS